MSSSDFGFIFGLSWVDHHAQLGLVGVMGKGRFRARRLCGLSSFVVVLVWLLGGFELILGSY